MNALAHVPPLKLSPQLKGRVRYNEPLAKHTTWRVGGPADVFYKPADKHDLALFLRTLDPQMSVFWLGLGSNVLVRDGGLRGAVIDTHGALDELKRVGDTQVWCDAGVACAKLAKQCAKWQLGPGEFFAGIPGTLGGALAMNAGAFGGETWPHVVQVETVDRHGEVRMRPASDYRVSYRHVDGPADEWFVAAQLKFAQRSGALDAGETEIRALLARRKQTQPIGEPSCGSVFTNPPDNFAARLIEGAGLKGVRIGGAVVSTKHANFIINEGTATAADIEQLIEHVKAVVNARYGIELKPEVRIVGEALPAKEPS